MPPLPVNRLLEEIFAGEARPLIRSLDRFPGGYPNGVSLIALLRLERSP